MWSIYTGNNVCKQLPTEELWNKLSNILDFDIPYNNIQMTFNAQMGLTDVWSDINFYSQKRIHPTQKPETLINRLVLASSNPNDKVLDPFMGSGTTAISCKKNNRNFIGFEIDEKYYLDSIKRIQEL